MRITVLYFAAARDLAGVSEELLDLASGVRTVGDLRIRLASLRPALAGRLEQVRFARNEEFASDGDALLDGDVIALIPPVAGG